MLINATQLQSLATAELGNAVAVYVTTKSGPTMIPGLQKLATDLPAIPLGKVSATEMGSLTASLETAQTQIAASASAGETVQGVSNLQQVAEQLASLIALVTTSLPSATGGLETVDQAVAVQYLSNFSSGILNGIAFYQGEHPAS